MTNLRLSLSRRSASVAVTTDGLTRTTRGRTLADVVAALNRDDRVELLRTVREVYQLDAELAALDAAANLAQLDPSSLASIDAFVKRNATAQLVRHGLVR